METSVQMSNMTSARGADVIFDTDRHDLKV